MEEGGSHGDHAKAMRAMHHDEEKPGVGHPASEPSPVYPPARRRGMEDLLEPLGPVHTPTRRGTYSFPTTQKLSDGEEIEWKGDGVTSEHPAPTVRVVDQEGEPAPDAGHDHQ